MKLLDTLAHAAERHSNGFVSAAGFKSRVLQELAAVHVEWNARIEVAVASMFSLAAGQEFMPAHAQPSTSEDE